MSDTEPTGQYPIINPNGEGSDPRDPTEQPWYRRPGGIEALAATGSAIVVLLIVLIISLTGDDEGDVVVTDGTPTPEETVEPTPEPTAAEPTPTADATPEPTPDDTPAETPTPVATPTPEPTTEPTAEPTATSEPSPTAEPTPGDELACSADGLDELENQLDLPDVVAARRDAIGTAALSCDIDSLVALTAPDFTASFGGGDPATLWAGEEESGGEPLKWLVDILRLPYGVIEIEGEEPIYAWPSAHTFPSWEEVPRTDRQALLEVYTEEDLDQFEAFGGYAGYRVGITESGRWIYFVAGD